ncbi:MAG: sugar O-acetyltransferase [Oscillospiraceae bacterium]|nr:sugar O-acetyltransferase [Oscillospiraceae bacterium]
MTEHERLAAGLLFRPGDPELKAIKRRAHALSAEYSATLEDETERRAEILRQLLGALGPGGFLQGPVFFHYGVHTFIGRSFFANYDLTVQDDAVVTIGDNVNFGPGVTIVTPFHPLLPDERLALRSPSGEPGRYCWAKPVTIGSNVWFGANVTVYGGVTVGDGCVVGAGSVVVRDLPPMCVAVGNPCRVLRPITGADSVANLPELLGGCRPLDD